jgi:hypothetical protein
MMGALVWLVAACAVLAWAMPAPVAMSADAVGEMMNLRMGPPLRSRLKVPVKSVESRRPC